MPVIPSDDAWNRVSRVVRDAERARPQRDASRRRTAQGPQTFPAIILGSRLWDAAERAVVLVATATTVRQFRWSAARLGGSTGAWGELGGFLSSSLDGDDYAYPAYGSSRLADVPVDTIVPLFVAVNDDSEPHAWFQRETVSGDVIAGRITAVTGTVNAVYDAEAISDPSIAVADAAPINRAFDTAGVSFTPATVGATCLLVIRTDVDTVELVAFELTQDGAACEEGP